MRQRPDGFHSEKSVLRNCNSKKVSEAHIRERVRSDSFTSLLSVIEAAREPRVQFEFVATTRGLDFVAEVRGHPLH